MRIFFSELCLICGRELYFEKVKNYALCDKCEKAIKPISGKRCEICGINLISEQKKCTRCREISYSFDKHKSLFYYSDRVKELIYQYKFNKKIRLSYYFAALFHKVIQERYGGIPIIPVPSQLHSVKKRGWDHMKEITNKLKPYHKIYYCLRRLAGKSQKILNFEERRENIKGKISVILDRLPENNTALLIDDIFTTGATMNECARVLKEAGLQRIYSITLALDW
jgi:competence protein ComFC